MSNNDLWCSKCKSHHHPVECPMDTMTPKEEAKCDSWITVYGEEIKCQWAKDHEGCHSGYGDICFNGKVKWGSGSGALTRRDERIRELENDLKSWKDSFSDSVEHIKELESKLKEKEEEIERLKNLTHFGYSQVPELESKLKTAVEAIKLGIDAVDDPNGNQLERKQKMIETLEQIRGGQK